MELDRDVSEYMQCRNVLATKVGGTISMQILLTAFFLAAYGHTDVSGKNILILLTVLITAVVSAAGVIVVIRGRKVYSARPDYMGLKQSEDVIRYAYEIARPVLIFKMTLSAVIIAAGILIALYTSKIVFLISVSAGLCLFIPSFDRLRAYKEMLSGHTDILKEAEGCYYSVCSASFIVLMPVSICVYLLWHYYGPYQKDIAWITFCVAAIAQGTVMTLAYPRSR